MFSIASLEPAFMETLTRGVNALPLDVMQAAIADLQEKRKTPDPENPNLWSTEVRGVRVWCILDEGAGLNGENLYTFLLPGEY